MSLIPGSRLGSYEILSRLGAGGMGEVYCARDTKLGRQVAIKVLPDAVAQDPERLTRFEREARVLAALNHPNIAQIYGIEGRALVMELVEGQTLKGPLSPETALDYARQIADALEAAHNKGITHRDLKPANIMITSTGMVKVLDFGLAAVSQDSAVDAENSPTLTLGQTQSGMIMGTAAYMSPEQASGKSVDKRADIWAFGVVLFEMLTGQQVFRGETISHTLAAVLAKEPDLAHAPARFRPIIEKCLRKDPRSRWRDIGDVRMALDEPAAEPPAARTGIRIWQTIAAVLALGIGAALWAPWRAPSISITTRPFLQLDLDLGSDAISQPVLSPDGSIVVFVSKGQLMMRRLGDTTNTPFPGTEGASFPFFSPDGRWVAFFADSKIKKVALQGGAPTPICDAAAARGGSWGEDGFIIAPLQSIGGLMRIPVAGGTPQPLTSSKDDPEGFAAHRWPQVLPGGKAVLFAATTGARGSVRVVDAGGKMKTLVRNSTYGRYVSGHLIYYQTGALYAAPMSLDRLELTGPAVPLVEHVAYTTGAANADFDVSAAGTLVYVRGARETGRVVSWLDSTGKVTPIVAKAGEYLYPKLSPDGNRLAIVLEREGKVDLWIHDLSRETLTQITFDGKTKGYPVWTANGGFVVLNAGAITWIRADGSGKDEHIETASVRPFPWSLSRDGARLAFFDTTGIRTLSVTETPAGLRLSQPEPAFQNGTEPAISPDGRFVAYASSQSGRSEIYVMPLPPPGKNNEPKAGRWPISNDGGSWPVWPPSGREIFYIGADRRIRAAAYTIKGDSFAPEKPRVWSERVLADVGSNPDFDMDSSGKRAVVMIDAGGESKPETHFRVMLNLDDELRRRTTSPEKTR